MNTLWMESTSTKNIKDLGFPTLSWLLQWHRAQLKKGPLVPKCMFFSWWTYWSTSLHVKCCLDLTPELHRVIELHGCQWFWTKYCKHSQFPFHLHDSWLSMIFANNEPLNVTWSRNAQYTAQRVTIVLLVVALLSSSKRHQSTIFLWAPSQRPCGHGLCSEQVKVHGPLKVNTPPHKTNIKMTYCLLIYVIYMTICVWLSSFAFGGSLRANYAVTMLCSNSRFLWHFALSMPFKQNLWVPDKSAQYPYYAHMFILSLHFFTFLSASPLHLDILDSSEHCWAARYPHHPPQRRMRRTHLQRCRKCPESILMVLIG